MKKIVSLVLTACLAFGVLGFAAPQSASAGSHSGTSSKWKKDCKATNTGKVCGRQYKDYYITAHWGKKDVKKIVKHKDFTTGNKWALGALLAGMAKKPTGLAPTIVSMGFNATSSKFNTAKVKSKGVTFKYTYRIYKGGTTSGSYKIVSSKWSYNNKK